MSRVGSILRIANALFVGATLFVCLAGAAVAVSAAPRGGQERLSGIAVGDPGNDARIPGRDLDWRSRRRTTRARLAARPSRGKRSGSRSPITRRRRLTGRRDGAFANARRSTGPKPSLAAPGTSPSAVHPMPSCPVRSLAWTIGHCARSDGRTCRRMCLKRNGWPRTGSWRACSPSVRRSPSCWLLWDGLRSGRPSPL